MFKKLMIIFRSHNVRLIYYFLYSVFYFCIFNSEFLSAQTSKIDSLKQLLISEKTDTTKINLLNKLSAQLQQKGVYDTALFYAENAKKLAEKLDFKKGVADSYHNIGSIYRDQGNYHEALKNYFTSLKIKEEIGDKQGISNSYNNIGVIYDYQGNYPEALKNHFTSLKIKEEIGDKHGIASSYNNIGIIYRYQGNYPEALKNYFTSLRIREEIGDKAGIADSYNNIGIVYDYQGNYHKVNQVERDSLFNLALKNHFASIKIREETGDKQGIAYSYNNIGNVYADQGNYHEVNKVERDSLFNLALKNYFASLKIEEEIGDKAGIAASFLNIGSTELRLNNNINSKKYLDDALALAKEIGYKDYIKETFIALSQLDSTTGNFKGAYSNYKFYSFYKDSLFSEEKSKEIGRLEMRHEFEVADIKRMQEEEEAKSKEAEAVSRRNMLQYSGIVIVLFVIGLMVVLFARFNVPVRVIEATLFISFLIFFEFILVFLDPYIENYTGGEPAWSLLVNAILASCIFPLHAFLEAKLKASVIKTERKGAPCGRPEIKNTSSKSLLLLLGLAFISLMNISFSEKSDSLIRNSKFEIRNSKDDTTKINLLNKLSGQLCRKGVYDTAIYHAENAIKLAEKLDFKQGMATSYNNIGIIHQYQGNYHEALKNYFTSLKIREEASDKKGIASSYNNIGIIYQYQGNYPEALKNYFTSLKIRKEVGDKKDIAGSYSNIGVIYSHQGNYPEALKNHFASLKIKEEIGDKQGIATSYSNIGIIYTNQGNYPEALKNHFASLKIKEGTGDKKGIAASYNNIGIVYSNQGNFPGALKNYFASLKIKEEIGDKKGIADSYNNIGIIYTNQGNYPEVSQTERDSLFNLALKNYFTSLRIEEEIGDKPGIATSFLNIGSTKLKLNNIDISKKYLDDALDLAKEIGYKELIKETYNSLSQLDSTTGNFKSAFSNYKIYSLYKDSLFSEEKSKEIGRLEMRHEFEVAEIKRMQEEEEAKSKAVATVSRRNMLQYSGIVIVLFIIGLMVVLFARFKVPVRVVEGAMFISFLIFFEFILVMLDPYIEVLSSGAPAWKLLANAGIAGVIYPLHSFFEGLMKKRLFRQKRRKIEKMAISP